MTRVRRLQAGLYWVWADGGIFQVARVNRQTECGCTLLWEVRQRFGLRSEWRGDFATLDDALVSVGAR